MIKLLYITNGINGSGGLERVLSVKASYLADKMDYEVHILVLNDTHKNPFYTFSEQIKYHSIAVSGNSFQYFIQYKKGIRTTINTIKPDVISVCDDGLKGMLFPVLFGKRIPVIYERHVSKQIEQKGHTSLIKRIVLKIKYNLMNFGGKKFHRFVVLTNGNLNEWNFNNLQVIPNPLPFYPKEYSILTNKKVLVVGKQSYQKGYDRLLKIWQKISPKYPDWKLEIYGKLDSSFGFEKILKDYGIEKTASFYPPEKNIQKKYQEASIYLMSSHFEGFGMVLIEAMAYGVPCIAFDCPHGPADIISHNKDGLLIKNGNIESFSKALLKLIGDFELRKQMGINAKENVKRYLPDQILLQWDLLFKTIVNR